MNSEYLILENGFYPIELQSNTGVPFQWMKRNARIRVESRSGILEFKCAHRETCMTVLRINDTFIEISPGTHTYRVNLDEINIEDDRLNLFCADVLDNDRDSRELTLQFFFFRILKNYDRQYIFLREGFYEKEYDLNRKSFQWMKMYAKVTMPHTIGKLVFEARIPENEEQTLDVGGLKLDIKSGWHTYCVELNRITLSTDNSLSLKCNRQLISHGDSRELCVQIRYMYVADFELTYKKNRSSLLNYCWWKKNIPKYNELQFKISIGDENKFFFEQPDGNKKSIIVKRTKDIERTILGELQNPILTTNEMNIYHWKYLMDNVRASEDYGDDNHIYMYYESYVDFLAFLHVVDITPYLNNEKFVFLFGENELKKFYPLDFKKIYGINYSDCPQKPLRIDEIKRIIISQVTAANTGAMLISNILDMHKDILTLPNFTLASFSYWYEKVLKEKTINDAREAIISSTDECIVNEIKYLFSGLIRWGNKDRRIPVPSIAKFFHTLTHMFPKDYRPSKIEWFKAFYLAYAVSMNRTMNQRIAPAILFTNHSMIERIKIPIGKMYDIFYQFNYHRWILMMRRFTISMGASADINRNIGNTFLNAAHPIITKMEICREKNHSTGYYAPVYADFLTDYFFLYKGVLRFEDLKLFPRESLIALCKFLDIEWDNTLLFTTVNGKDTEMYNGKRFVGGFDTGPVYDRHETFYSVFDYYRMEVLLSNYFLPWGYKPMYYTDGVRYSKDDILKMFQIQFKAESFVTDSCKKFHLWFRSLLPQKIDEILSRPFDIGINRLKLIPIHWIKPNIDREKGSLYE